MDTTTPAAPAAAAPMTQDELNGVIQQILKAERGECEPPTAEVLQRAYDSIRVNRAAASSRRAAGAPGKAATPLPTDLNELF